MTEHDSKVAAMDRRCEIARIISKAGRPLTPAEIAAADRATIRERVNGITTLDNSTEWRDRIAGLTTVEESSDSPVC